MASPRNTAAARRFRLSPYVAALALGSGALQANPGGGSVVAGAVTFTAPDAQTLVVEQSTDRAILDWQSFSIGADELVRFVQPSASSLALNRVVGSDPSHILGSLQANGRVFLVNPNGVLFGAGARVDVGGLLATSLDIDNAAFLAGDVRLVGGDGAGSVRNQGQIRTGEGGFVVLAGDQVSNEGLIATPGGDVVLAAGGEMLLSLDEQGLIGFSVERSTAAALAGIDNLGQILADGGRVQLDARLASALARTAVNNAGLIRADRVDEQGGEILLLAGGGSVQHAGLIEADGGHVRMTSDRSITLALDSRLSARDGVVEISATDRVQIHGELALGGGALRIDPANITIGEGGEGCGGADLCETDIETLLAGGADVEVIASNLIRIQDLADGALDGRAADGSGGSLFLGIGSGSANSFQGFNGRISLADRSDAIRVDGNFTALAGSSSGDGVFGDVLAGGELRIVGGARVLAGDLSAGSSVNLFGGNVRVGNVSAPSITIAGSSGRVEVGSLTAVNPTGAASVNVFADFGIRVAGDVVVRGSVSAYVGGSSSSSGRQRLSAAGLRLFAADSGMSVGGDIQVIGNLGTVSQFGGSSTLIAAADANLITGRGNIQIDGGVEVRGSIGTLEAFGTFDAAASRLEFHGGVDGGIGAVLVGESLTVRGTIGNVIGSSFYNATGAYIYAEALNARLAIGGGIDLEGLIGDVGGGGALVSASGATLELVPDFDLSVAGDVRVHGEVDSAELGNVAVVLGASVLTVPFSGDASFGGAFILSGTVGDVTAGGLSGVTGIQMTALGLGEDFDFGGVLDFAGPINLFGTVGNLTLGSNAQVTGAGLFLETQLGDVRLRDTVTVNGIIGNISAGNDFSPTEIALDATGAYVYGAAFNGSTVIDGNVRASGTIGNVSGPFFLGVTGATVNLIGAFDTQAPLPGLRLGGRVDQESMIGTVTALDPDNYPASVLSGAVTLDGSSGAVSFGDVTADNIFVYYDSDSVVGDVTLIAREYLELFTPSISPVLSGGSLRVQAQDAFLSINTDLQNFEVDAGNSITVFISNVDADRLDLSTGGGLALIASNLGSDAVDADVVLRGDVVYGDEFSTIQASSLDVQADSTILFEGFIGVGTGHTQRPGDQVLIDALRLAAPELVPDAIAPNAYFSAPEVALRSVGLLGDWLQIESNFLFLGELAFGDEPAFVHVDPLVDLPFFAENVDLVTTGLITVEDRLRTDGGRVIPSVGGFDDVRGRDDLLGGGRPLPGQTRPAGLVDVTPGPERMAFDDLIFGTGLADQTIAIGASDYVGAIQISDAQDVDLRPSTTNLIIYTESGSLGSERVQTNGQVLVLGGQVFTSREDFYALVRDQITTYYTEQEGVQEKDEEEAEEESSDGVCEAAAQ